MRRNKDKRNRTALIAEIARLEDFLANGVTRQEEAWAWERIEYFRWRLEELCQ